MTSNPYFWILCNRYNFKSNGTQALYKCVEMICWNVVMVQYELNTGDSILSYRSECFHIPSRMQEVHSNPGTSNFFPRQFRQDIFHVQPKFQKYPPVIMIFNSSTQISHIIASIHPHRSTFMLLIITTKLRCSLLPPLVLSNQPPSINQSYSNNSY
jgi:hypothetical protein